MGITKRINSSVQRKLFLTMVFATFLIILSFVIINNIVLENVYINTKIDKVKTAYHKIDKIFNDASEDATIFDLDDDISRIAAKNNFDILIRDSNEIVVYSSDRNFTYNLDKIYDASVANAVEMYKSDKGIITRIEDEKNSMNYIFLKADLTNGFDLYIRVSVASIQESVRISNQLLIAISLITILIAGISASIISRRFTDPIKELNEIAKRMSKQDFSKKYRINDCGDEIDELGKSINEVSVRLENTIKRLKKSNIELEKDVEEKAKIEEMRTRFISDVSHELKTPIALIQGYSEGLIDNVNTDEESRKYYAEVILDEINKMDKLVKQLLELMKLEYGERKFNDKRFNINELISEVIRKSDLMLKEKDIVVKFEYKKPIYVNADEFYIDQVVTNYLTNAIKHVKEVKGNKEIIVTTKITKQGKVRVEVYNTGDKLDIEQIERVWKRFYKADESRNRKDGGTGIGLAIVKAIMNNYKENYGVENYKDGVKFYFELTSVK